MIVPAVLAVITAIMLVAWLRGWRKGVMLTKWLTPVYRDRDPDRFRLHAWLSLVTLLVTAVALIGYATGMLR